MVDTTPLASLSLTHVYYDPDDNLSLVCAYLALLPQALVIVYATLVLATREAEIALMFIGQLGCEALNFVLKRLIKEERPRKIHGKGYGMPSSHAQFVAYWSVSLALFLLVRHCPPKVLRGRVASSIHRPWSVVERMLVCCVAFGLAAATAWSRVYLAYHTPKQVMFGCCAGVVSAVGWFVVTGVLRQTGLLGWFLDQPLVRAFRVRDLAVEEDMCQAGWEKWEERRRTVVSREEKIR